MSQVSRQNVQTHVEKDFCKLMNNSNFGHDCRNNADNCIFQPIYNKIEELLLKRQIEEEFLNKLYALNTQDEFYKARKNSLEIQKKKKRAGRRVLDEKLKAQKNIKKNSIKGIGQKLQDKEKCSKAKFIIEFDPTLACRVKCLTVKKNANVKPTTRFFSEKMLTFSIISLESFAYNFTETFFFLSKKTRKIYNKYMIEWVFPYSVLTDMDSICVFFIFICKP